MKTFADYHIFLEYMSESFNLNHKGQTLRRLGQIKALCDNFFADTKDSISCYVKHSSVSAPLNANIDCGW